MAILDLQETHGIWFRYLRSAACICWSKAFLFLYICKLCDSNFKNARSSILPADSRFSVCNLFVLTRCARQQQFRIGRFILFWTKMNCKSARWESHFFLWLLAYLMYNAWNSWRPWCIESATKRRQDLQSNPTNVAAYILKFTLQVEVGRAYALFFSTIQRSSMFVSHYQYEESMHVRKFSFNLIKILSIIFCYQWGLFLRTTTSLSSTQRCKLSYLESRPRGGLHLQTRNNM